MLGKLVDLLLGKLLGRWMDRAEQSRDTEKRAESLNLLKLDDDGTTRYFTWRGRGAIHVIDVEEQPQQLLKFDSTLCNALRRESGMEPQFNLPKQLTGEVVYEVSPDFKVKWRLLGGAAAFIGSC